MAASAFCGSCSSWRAAEVGIGGAEQFLRQHQHARLVALRHAQDLHDDMQRVVQRHLVDEIASAVFRQHVVDGCARDLADAVFQAFDVLRHEPGLGQRAVFRMIRRVHLHEAAHQMRRAARHRAHALVAFLIGQRRLPVAIVEEGVLAADLQNVGVLRDHPERVIALQLRAAERVVRAQPFVGVMDLARRISLRCYKRPGMLFGNTFGDHFMLRCSIRNSLSSPAERSEGKGTQALQRGGC